MLLSVIIVNYNVRHFLDHCLRSVEKALRQLQETYGENAQTEIWVVDNRSTDGSMDYLPEAFPRVKFISNDSNTGFARANNQALRKAGGNYILFLNPDTILPENIFTTCIGYLEQHTDAGALGVRMIDGSGRFLKESKRGFPGPWTSFCKMTGLTALFPRSRRLARYYAGHLPEQETNVIDVLPGAFMLVRKTVLDLTGGFDERFFMYAEDIDLSYRIRLRGYKNYYLPECSILHFKGESTARDSRYVKLFYKAMVQFVKKHYQGGWSKLYPLMLEPAIWLRGGIAQAGQWFRSKKPKTLKNDKVLIIGDSATAHRLSDIFYSRQNHVIVLSESDPELLREILEDGNYGTVVFCEHTDFGFADIIAVMPFVPKNRFISIHAQGSVALIGSFNNKTQGVVTLLNNG